MHGMHAAHGAFRWTGETVVVAGARSWSIALGTERGAHRAANEDTVAAEPELRLVTVIDGVGGVGPTWISAAQLAREALCARLRSETASAGAHLEDALVAAGWDVERTARTPPCESVALR